MHVRTSPVYTLLYCTLSAAALATAKRTVAACTTPLRVPLWGSIGSCNIEVPLMLHFCVRPVRRPWGQPVVLGVLRLCAGRSVAPAVMPGNTTAFRTVGFEKSLGPGLALCFFLN